MNTINTLAKQWWNEIEIQARIKLFQKYCPYFNNGFGFGASYNESVKIEIENIFYQEVILVWWDNLDNKAKGKFSFVYYPTYSTNLIGETQIKEMYLNEHSVSELDDEVADLEEELWNSPTGSPDFLEQPKPVMKFISLDEVKKQFAKLSDEERMEVIGDYCKYCGCNDSGCQCWNDD